MLELRFSAQDVALTARRTGGCAGPRPSPHTPVAELADELELLRTAAPEYVRAELDSVVPAPRRSAEADSLHRDPEGGLDLLAHLVRDYWELAIAPHWPRIRALWETGGPRVPGALAALVGRGAGESDPAHSTGRPGLHH